MRDLSNILIKNSIDLKKLTNSKLYVFTFDKNALNINFLCLTS